MITNFFRNKQNLIIKTWEKWLKKKFQLGFSSEIKVPQLGSARARKFQLGLITRLCNKHISRPICPLPPHVVTSPSLFFTIIKKHDSTFRSVLYDMKNSYILRRPQRFNEKVILNKVCIFCQTLLAF